MSRRTARTDDQAHRYMRALLDGFARTYPAQVEIRNPSAHRLGRNLRAPRWTFSDWLTERSLVPIESYRLVEAGIMFGYPLYILFKDPQVAFEFRLRWT